MSLFINIVITLLMIPFPVVVMMSPMLITSSDFRTEVSNILLALVLLNYPLLLFGALVLSGQPYFYTNPVYWMAGVGVFSIGLTLLYGLPQLLLNVLQNTPNDHFYLTPTHVYCSGKKIRGADPSTFQVISESGEYSKDNTHVYYCHKKIKGADPDTFAPLDPSYPILWKDDRQVYYYDRPIPKADGSTYLYLGEGYGKDARMVFFLQRPVKGADPGTFSVTGNMAAKDQHHSYFKGKKI